MAQEPTTLRSAAVSTLISTVGPMTVDRADSLVALPSRDVEEALPMITLAAPPTSRTYLVAKRALDIVASALALLVLSPLFLLLIVLVRLTSRGPAFFRQQRVGEGGRIFTMLKFRSMYINADHSLHEKAYAHFLQGKGGDGKVTKESLALLGVSVETTQAADLATPLPAPLRAVIVWLVKRWAALRPEDPRVTTLGGLLRRTSFDELPQFFNVLIGDMSLVGPRPPIPYEVTLYKEKHMARLAVPPGVTGVWQVRGRNRVPFEQMIDMDLEYIQRRSFWFDLQLLLMTVPSMLFSRSGK